MEKIDWDFLIEELRKGNNAVLKIFYEEHANNCIQKLERENKCSREDAEDIFIESVMNLRERLVEGKTQVIMNVGAYLYKTCYNMFLIRLKQKDRMKSQSGEVERFYYGSIYLEGDNEPFDTKLLEIANKAWDFLSERCKDILYHFYVDKLDMKKIADLMDLASSDVAKTTKSRCYKKWTEKALELKDAKTRFATE